MCVMPLTGITGMMKKMVMKRIPLFRTNWATVPHCPQCIRCSVRIDPQTKKWSPMMSIVFTCAESVPRAWLRTMARPGGPRSLPLAVLIQLLRLLPGGLLTGADEIFRRHQYPFVPHSFVARDLDRPAGALREDEK